MEIIPDDEDPNRFRLNSSSTDDEGTSAFPLDPLRIDSNISEGVQLSTSSSATCAPALLEGSEPLSMTQTRQSSRAPSGFYYERHPARSGSSRVSVLLSTDNGEQLDPTMEPVTPVLGTDHRLENFEKVVHRGTSRHPELDRQRKDRLEEIRRLENLASTPRRTLKDLQAQLDKDDTSVGYSNRFVRRIPGACSQKANGPPEEKALIKLAHHFYPPVGEVEVHVFDFGPNYSNHITTTLGNIEAVFASKPQKAKVRWIHVSVGIGVTHSSVEELFLKGGPGRGESFTQAGTPGWPYLSDTILELHHKDYFKEKRDAFFLLRNRHELSKTLDNTLFLGLKKDTLKENMEWRCDHLNIEPRFWNLARGELPRQLSENIIMIGSAPQDGLKPVERSTTEQMLLRYPFFGEARARLVQAPFRAFHRSDGCLLTLSPMNGINYLDKDFAEKLKEPPGCRINDESTSALARVWQVFEKTGTSTWPSETVEWFLVYLMTEVSATPHSISQGYNAPSLPQAYEAVALDLKRRRLEKFRRNASVALVRDYIACIEELATISKILERKRSFLERLRQDCNRLEDGNAVPQRRSDDIVKIEKSMVGRVDWALDIVTEQDHSIRSILEDLEGSMQALYNLKSVEQNELAIDADAQNQAILVLACVTTIFLPLSFFTSYFGMNLKGVRETDRSESYFWAVCGSIGLFILFFILPIAFRHEIRNLQGKKTRKNDNVEEIMTAGSRLPKDKQNWLTRLTCGIHMRRTGRDGFFAGSEKFANDVDV